MCMQTVGTGGGMPALQGVLPRWGEAVARLPPHRAASFAAPLLRAPAAFAVVNRLGGPLLGALGRAVLSGNAAAAEAALPLLVDVTKLLPQVRRSGKLP